ncbi:MAG: anthranilate synthase component I family protein [Ruminococcus sp.]|jgi:anthranilate synthase component 1|nr:anthranilate synthase component I family protein [Ruminococcus sp.]
MIDFKQVKKLAVGYDIVPIYTKIPRGNLTAEDVFLKLKNLSKHCFILESTDNASGNGRYTFIGFNPTAEITCKNAVFTVKSDISSQTIENNPTGRINEILSGYRSPRIDDLPPFTGGLAGFFSFDYIKYSESSLHFPDSEENFNDLDLMLFLKLIAFDNVTDEIIIISNAKTDALEENYNKSISDITELERIIKTGGKTVMPKLCVKSEFTPSQTKSEYCEAVKRAKRYIKEGDIFQVVLSNRFTAECEGSLFETYEILKRKNPSPYMLYFSSDNIEIAGSAPETLVSLNGDILSTYPLAGTRKRGATPEEDFQLEKDLLSDEKELSEHNMLVDLGRNDIGKISELGSVEVPEYKKIIRFSHVMHIGSKVTGRIKKGLSAANAIEALLPAGTLSGAPKIRACEIISELEGEKLTAERKQCPRGIYGGAIGYISFSGDMDVCIAIRLAYKKRNTVYVRSGAGIVFDSVPENEWIECKNKAQAVINAIEEASR